MCCCYFPQQENPRDVFVEELHLPLKKRPSRNDDLTIVMLVVRVRPYCSSKNLRFFKFPISHLRSQIVMKSLSLLFTNLLDHNSEIARHRRQDGDQSLSLAIDQEHHLRN